MLQHYHGSLTALIHLTYFPTPLSPPLCLVWGREEWGGEEGETTRQEAVGSAAKQQPTYIHMFTGRERALHAKSEVALETTQHSLFISVHHNTTTQSNHTHTNIYAQRIIPLSALP